MNDHECVLVRILSFFYLPVYFKSIVVIQLSMGIFYFQTLVALSARGYAQLWDMNTCQVVRPCNTAKQY